MWFFASSKNSSHGRVKVHASQGSIGSDQSPESDSSKNFATGEISEVQNASSIDSISKDEGWDAEDEKEEQVYQHPFENPELRAYWMEEYEKSRYENRHLIDHNLTWTKQEERRVVLKSDIHAMSWAFIMFLALDIDRFNLANAVAGNLLQDLHISSNDYNLGSMINLICFLAAELPSQLVSKAVGADRFLPTQVVLWSICAVCQCRMKNKAGFLVLRCLIGFLEGGFIPEQLVWLQYFYTNREYTVRTSIFYAANSLTQAFSSLLAAAIQTLDGKGGWHGWQYIFLIEGLITLLVGLLSYKMPATVSKTKKWYRPRGWYTDREVKIMVNRILRDDPSKGTMNNRQGITPKMLWNAICDYDMWPLYFSRFLIDASTNPIGRYVPLILKSMHFKPIIVNLLMAPYNITQIVMMVGQTLIARKFRENGWFLFLSAFWPLIPILCMRYWKGFLHEHWGSYALMFVALSGPPSNPITSSWTAENSYSVARRTVSAALLNMFSQASGIAASQIFQEDDAPRYPKGLEALIGISVGACCFVLTTRYWYVWRNRQKDKTWDKMSPRERLHYTRTTQHEGNKRLDFRFTT